MYVIARVEEVGGKGGFAVYMHDFFLSHKQCPSYLESGYYLSPGAGGGFGLLLH